MMPQLRASLVLLLLPLAGQAVQSQPSVEVLIPKGMPIKVDVQRDKSEPEIVKYIIRRIVGNDARQAKITTAMLDASGTILFLCPTVGGQLGDPMSIATADGDVARILLVVEWLKTDKGKWVLDAKTPKLDIESLIKHGAAALPRARFIGKE